MNRLKITIPDLTPNLNVFQEMSEVYDWGLLDLNIPNVHKITLGENVKVAIVDSGKSEHFEVKNNTIASKNFSSSNTVNDTRGHNTFVSGIIAAEKNDEGVIGVAPKTQLYFAKAVDDSGSGNPSAMVKSIYWAVEQKVDIISISAGMFIDFKPLREAVQFAYNKNIVLVAATGNTGTKNFDVAFPARYPEVIGVAAYDKNHKAAPFSSRGVNVFCAMPGVDIYSTWLNNQYCKLNGTSFSCPIMTGICALIISKLKKENKTYTPQTIKDQLKKFSKKLNDDPKAVGFGTVDLNELISKG